LTSLTLTGSAGSELTQWAFDQSTGMLQSKTFADGSVDQYQYNARQQLTNLIEPGISSSAFGYNTAGELVSSSLTDSSTGTVSSNVVSLDEMGRPNVVADTDNGRTNTTITTYNAQQQLAQTIFGSAGGASVNYAYYPTSNFGSNGEPGALQTMTVSTPTSQSAPTGYNYDPVSKRIQTISVNGVAIQYQYLANSNQIQTVTAGPVDANGNLTSGDNSLVTTYTPDSTDKSRVHIMQTMDNIDDETLYSGVYGYNQQDQMTSEGIVAAGPNGTIQHNYVYGYSAANADALTSVTDTNNTPVASYSFDGAGNFVNTAFNTSLGTANIVNQYSNLTYNSRGDVTTDVTTSGTYSLGWDAADRLISITPVSPINGAYKLSLGYDGQSRLLWKDVYTWNAGSGTWNYAYSRHYVWDGENLIEELDQNNNLITGYTWGPTGLLAVTDYIQSPAKTYIAVNDASGNMVGLMDPATGSAAAVYTYDPYGNLLTMAGPAANLCEILGKGYIVDQETRWLGFAPNPAGNGPIRILNFNLDLYMQRDPAGEIAGGFNPYQPFGGDPINESDSSGDSYSDEDWTNAKDKVARQYYSGNGVGSYYINPLDSKALQNAYDTDVIFKLRVDDEVANSKFSLFETVFPATAQQIGSTNIPSGYVQWNDGVVVPAATKLAASEATLLASVPAAGDGIVTAATADSLLTGIQGVGLAAWGLDNTYAALRLQPNDTFLASGVTQLTGSSTAGQVVNGLAGLGLAASLPVPGGADPVAELEALESNQAAGTSEWSLPSLAGASTGGLSFRSLSAASITDPAFEEFPTVQEAVADASTARSYNAALEVQLRPSEFGLSDAEHFSIANQAFGDFFTETPATEAAARAMFGDDFIDSLLDGRTPEGFTWHHALASQADGEAGWLHLVDQSQHISDFELFHPNGIGGYQEWAVPAGAPYPR